VEIGRDFPRPTLLECWCITAHGPTRPPALWLGCAVVGISFPTRRSLFHTRPPGFFIFSSPPEFWHGSFPESRSTFEDVPPEASRPPRRAANKRTIPKMSAPRLNPPIELASPPENVGGREWNQTGQPRAPWAIAHGPGPASKVSVRPPQELSAEAQANEGAQGPQRIRNFPAWCEPRQPFIAEQTPADALALMTRRNQISGIPVVERRTAKPGRQILNQPRRRFATRQRPQHP